MKEKRDKKIYVKPRNLDIILTIIGMIMYAFFIIKFAMNIQKSIIDIIVLAIPFAVLANGLMPKVCLNNDEIRYGFLLLKKCKISDIKKRTEITKKQYLVSGEKVDEVNSYILVTYTIFWDLNEKEIFRIREGLKNHDEFIAKLKSYKDPF